jgi:8-oxo-dGTP pyrophosphatase MutT (NUDIX family)
MQLAFIKSQLRLQHNSPFLSKMDPLPDNFRVKNNQESTPKHSAVVLLLFEKEEKTYGILTQRHEYEGAHGGQISLPGGKREDTDLTLQHTALRENQEEIGIKPEQVEIIHTLTDVYIPPSNYLVTPFVGVINKPPIYQLDDFEVKEVIEFPISRLFEKDVIQEKTMEFKNGISLNVKYFNIEDKVVWGATAIILEEFVHLIKANPF